MVLQQRSQPSKFTVRRLKFALEIVLPPSENTMGEACKWRKNENLWTALYVCVFTKEELI